MGESTSRTLTQRSPLQTERAPHPSPGWSHTAFLPTAALRELKSKELPAGHLLARYGNPPHQPLPFLRRALPPHLPAHRRRPARRQEHPGTGRVPPPCVRHLPGALVRAGSRATRHRLRPLLLLLRTHPPKGEPLLGTPLAPELYDYTGAVLWNTHAPALSACFVLHLRRTVAAVPGVPQRLLLRSVRVSYAKVAAYQQHGLIHFRATIHLDGPAGSYTHHPSGPHPNS